MTTTGSESLLSKGVGGEKSLSSLSCPGHSSHPLASATQRNSNSTSSSCSSSAAGSSSALFAGSSALSSSSSSPLSTYTSAIDVPKSGGGDDLPRRDSSAGSSAASACSSTSKQHSKTFPEEEGSNEDLTATTLKTSSSSLDLSSSFSSTGEARARMVDSLQSHAGTAGLPGGGGGGMASASHSSASSSSSASPSSSGGKGGGAGGEGGDLSSFCEESFLLGRKGLSGAAGSVLSVPEELIERLEILQGRLKERDEEIARLQEERGKLEKACADMKISRVLAEDMILRSPPYQDLQQHAAKLDEALVSRDGKKEGKETENRGIRKEQSKEQRTRSLIQRGR